MAEMKLTITGISIFAALTGAIAGILSSLPYAETLCAAWFFGAGFLSVQAIKTFSGGRWNATEKEAVIIGSITGAACYLFQIIFALVIEGFTKTFSLAEALGLQGVLEASESTTLIYIGYLAFYLFLIMTFAILGSFTAKTVLFTSRSSSEHYRNSL